MQKTATHNLDASERVAVSVDSLASMLDCGRPTAARIGAAAGARVQIGRRVLFRMDKINAYLDSITEQKQQ